ncbi:hypothetical protein A1Q1_07823 [Trichosporon asahii var. asahii CBS 2479]|uniref:Uncharacterized protein n=1 Tax=Trichosporon asahii var. asahii (strain ATCC 90039 / CBS 2479 / JCM 2466 / KCTC 7840 / NBRC 103889/ NCYC 2677 / UAMH 7654) TaxID=1186058 RepID=J6F250_TRIAS|nr:hypothetical protein A1Q1_07823 [Trichosporon asahii var. asahii CBS 2479]EJT51029.1 hypothetical protein A1Q1_07823 [Trichosporon asahii var. asahii CBS 2479]
MPSIDLLSVSRHFTLAESAHPANGPMLSPAEYATRCASINARYDEKLRQCQASFLAFKIAATRDISMNIPAGLQRMTQLNFKEDSEVLKIEFDREEELRELNKAAGYGESSKHHGLTIGQAPSMAQPPQTSHNKSASERAVAVGALAGIARGLLHPEDQRTRQEIDFWVAKFEAANGS